MLKDLVKYLIELKNPEKLEVGDRKWIKNNGAYDEILPERVHRPPVLGLATLTGLIDYLTNSNEKLPDRMIIHVETIRHVTLYESKVGHYEERPILATAEAPEVHIGEHYGNQEELLVALMTLFDPSQGDVAALIALASNVVTSETVSEADDGMSQGVTVAKGVIHRDRIEVKNPIKLAPFVTFSEVPAPLISYIYRMNGGGGESMSFRLIETYDPTWAKETMVVIGKYLGDMLNGLDEKLAERVTILV